MGCRDNGRFLNTALKVSYIAWEAEFQRSSLWSVCPNSPSSLTLLLAVISDVCFPLHLLSSSGVKEELISRLLSHYESVSWWALYGVTNPLTMSNWLLWYGTKWGNSRCEWYSRSSVQAPSLSLPVGLGNILSLVARISILSCFYGSNIVISIIL